MTSTRIKVCCIASIEEARLAIEAGATAIGLVSEMPSGPGVIPEDRIAAIAHAVPPGIGTFLLTSATDPGAIIDQQRRTGANTLQLVDQMPANSHATLRRTLPGIKIVQVIHVQDASAIAEAEALSGQVDAILLDSGNTKRDIRELGGTGRTHDWSISRRIVRSSTTPVFLAGGLNAANAGEAIREVGPYGLDLCSGVRTEDRLDPAKLSAFFSAVADSGALQG